MWGLIGIAIVILFIFLGRLATYLKQFMGGLNESFAEGSEEKTREGMWFYIAEFVRLLLFVIIVIVGYTILTYMFEPDPNVSIYHSVFDTWVGPAVTLSLLYYLIKIMGEIQYRNRAGGSDQAPPEGPPEATG